MVGLRESEPIVTARKKLVFLLTEDWFFLSHFLDRAHAARGAGYEVVVAARDNGDGATIREHGYRFVEVPFRRGGLNPLRELRTLLAIWRLYRSERPDIVHHVALKPIIYGSLAAGNTAVVNAPVGMGFVFSSQAPLARLLRPLIRAVLRRLLNPPRSRVVFENPDDLAISTADGSVDPAEAVLIRGAGVDIEAIRPSPEPPAPVRVVLVARMLKDKGVGEFIEAARLLGDRGYGIRFTLVGAPDPQNPSSMTEAELRALDQAGIVEWLGFRRDVPDILAQSHIVALPSYREGLPKTLLEAMAAERAIVTTDVPGCREVVTDEVTGLLVPARDAEALAAAIVRLAEDQPLRRAIARAGRRKAEAEFRTTAVAAATIAVYRSLVP